MNLLRIVSKGKTNRKIVMDSKPLLLSATMLALLAACGGSSSDDMQAVPE